VGPLKEIQEAERLGVDPSVPGALEAVAVKGDDEKHLKN
jgi:hypothetical protein